MNRNFSLSGRLPVDNCLRECTDADDLILECSVHGGSHRESRYQTASAHNVQHGHLFGHAYRWLVQRKAVAQYNQGGILRVAGQSGSHDVRGWHQAVGITVMLVYAHAVKP